MKFRPELRAVTIGVGLALFAGAAVAGSWGAPSQGDSGQGVDTVMANGLNATGLDVTVGVDTAGLGPYRTPVAHTPTGALYSVPWTEPESGSFHGSVEAGYINTSGDSNAAKLIEYRDLSSNPAINNFNFGAEGGDHRYFNVFGGGVGRNDQYYGAEFGVYNDWRVRAFYNETPHVFSTTARLIWNNTTTGNQSLVQNLQFTRTPTTGVNINPNAVLNATGTGLVIDDALRATAQGLQDSTIALTRQKGGIRFDKNLPSDWSVYVTATSEKRTGGRTWGQTGGGFAGSNTSNGINPATGALTVGNGIGIQMVEPIDYRTTDMRLGVSWADDSNALNVSVSASLFQDSIKRVLWENPDISPNTALTSATTAGVGVNRHVESYTTPPSNEAYYLNLDYMHAFGFWNTKLTSSLSYGIQNQNDELQPYTSATGFVAGFSNSNPVGDPASTGVVALQTGDLSYWNQMYRNGIATTTRQRSGLKNYVTNWNETLTMQPLDDLSLNAKLNYYNFNQDNDYLACNPALAASMGTSCDPATSGSAPIYGYLVEDGQSAAALHSSSGTGAIAGMGGVVRSYRTSFRTMNPGVGGDYRLSKAQSLNASLENESVWRKERERERTDELKFKLGYVNRDLFGGTLRAAYEYDDRTGTNWKVNTYLYSQCAGYDVLALRAQCQADSGTTGTGLATGFTVSQSLTSNPPDNLKLDLNDRKQHVVTLRYNAQLTDTLDMMITARSKNTLYPKQGMGVGITDRHEQTVSLDLNWQPTTATALYGYVTYQEAPQAQTSITGDPATAGLTVAGTANNAVGSGNITQASNCTTQLAACSAVVGGVNSIYGNAAGLQFFHYNSKDSNTVVGLGVSHTMETVRVDANYQYSRTRTSIDFVRQNMAGVMISGAGEPMQFSFPDMQYDRQQLNLNVTVPLDKRIAVRGFYLFDKADVADWHYDGLSAIGNNTGSGRQYVDGGPAQSYSAQTVGLMLQYKM